MKERSLEHAIAISAAWMVGLRLSYRLIGFVSTVILARLLTPEDFGVVAIAMSCFALVDIFSKLGFQTALIQNQRSESDHYSTAWTLNLLFGGGAALFLVIISGYVANIYGNSAIEEILWVVSLLFILNGVKNIGVVDFQKNLTFSKEFKLIIIPKFISFFITIGLALYFLNYWALVFGNVIWKILEVVVSYRMHPFRPKFCLNKGRELFSFSKWLMLNNVFHFINTRSPELILGKTISPEASAVYNLSFEIGTMSTSEIVSNLNRAIYPGYAKVSNQFDKIQSLYKSAIRSIALVAMPLGAGVALVSPFLVPLLLGDQWLEAVVPVSYLALGGAVNALGSNVNYVYYALGYPKISTFELGFKAIIFITLFYFLSGINGVVGVAQSFLVANSVALIVSWCVLRVVLRLSLKTQLSLYIRPFISTVIMAFSVLICMHLLRLEGGVALGAYSFIGMLVYCVSSFVLWRLAGKPSGLEERVFSLLLSRLKVVK